MAHELGLLQQLANVTLLLETLDVIDREADHQVHQDYTSEHDESKEHDPARGC